jgi:hypothetical protein
MFYTVVSRKRGKRVALGPRISASNNHPAGEVTEAVPPKPVRLESIDIVRGVIMILMALDHTRDFFGQTGFSPTDPTQTTIPLFFTRWITHFCAPVFFLLTGTGAYLSLRKKSKRELSLSIRPHRVHASTGDTVGLSRNPHPPLKYCVRPFACRIEPRMM